MPEVVEPVEKNNNIKNRCWDQREASPGEPQCVICGRYGEYICNETDDDICSLECKQILLVRVANSRPCVSVPPSLKLPTSDECFYVSDTNGRPTPQSSSNNQTEELRKKLEIRVRGGFVPDLTLSFSSCNLPQKLLQNIDAAGYEIPTPVQMQAIPAALAGKSLLVSAETGSGKTASYLIPIISHCAKFQHERPLEQKKPLAIVLVPTRELCIQVEEQAKVLGKGLPFKTALVVGGDAMAGQIYRIQQGIELIVATPGRLIDLLIKHDVELDQVSMFVVDEVDCMLERGFRDQVMQVYQALPPQLQVLMYSATIKQEIEKMAASMGKGVIVVGVGKTNRPSGAVKQIAIWVDPKKKKQKLFEILRSKQHFMPPAVVFVGSRMGADLLCEAIRVSTGMKAVSIHGEKSMKERREAMRSFVVGEVGVIVATGVLGRGVDMMGVGVRQVIVFDMPNSMEEYVHQMGRSRGGGTSIVFVNEEDDKNILREFGEMLKSSGAAIPRELSNLRYMGLGKRRRG